MDKKLNGFNNGLDASDGVEGGESLEKNMKWCSENMEIKEEKTMFDEMREAGSNIPNKVEYLQSHGWQSYKHHDNWVRKDLKDWEKDLCNFDLNSAYEEALREVNELPNAVEVLCNALREDSFKSLSDYIANDIMNDSSWIDKKWIGKDKDLSDFIANSFENYFTDEERTNIG